MFSMTIFQNCFCKNHAKQFFSRGIKLLSFHVTLTDQSGAVFTPVYTETQEQQHFTS